MRSKQLSFLPPPQLSHGGAIRHGKRKTARPIDVKRPMHLVMRATQARANWSMLSRRHEGRIFVMVRETAERFDVRIHRFSNVGNHLHLLISARTRAGFQGFLRSLAGAVALLVTGARKGKPLGERFWDLLAYSRIVNWGREFRRVLVYLVKNELEGLGAWSEGDLLNPLAYHSKGRPRPRCTH